MARRYGLMASRSIPAGVLSVELAWWRHVTDLFRARQRLSERIWVLRSGQRGKRGCERLRRMALMRFGRRIYYTVTLQPTY